MELVKRVSSRGLRSAPALCVGLFCLALALGSSPALADNVPPGVYPYNSAFADINAPVVGIASFNGSSFLTPGLGVPIDFLDVTLASGTFFQSYPNTVFSIDSGFAELQTVIISTNNLVVDNGDLVTTTIGPGTFSFKQAGVVVIAGSFSGASFNGQIGGASGATIASDTGSLDLFPGPAFDFDNGTFVSQILDPEGFAINLTSIPVPFGVQAVPTSSLGGGVFFGDLQPFGLSNGSVTTSGVAVVVPEPGSIVLATTACLGLGASALRRRRPTTSDDAILPV